MLKQLDGNENLLTELIKLFIDDAPTRLAKLNVALTKNDLNELADIAHTILGMAGQLFAEPSKTLARQLEYSARHNQGNNVASLSMQLVEAVTHLIKVLRQRNSACNPN